MAGNTYVSRLGNIRKNAKKAQVKLVSVKKMRISAALWKREKSCPVKTMNLIVDYRNVVLLFLPNFQCELEYVHFFKSKIWLVSQVLKPSAILSTSLCFCLLWHWRRANRRTYTSVKIDTYILSNDWHVNIYSHCAHAHYTFKPPLSPHYNWLHCRAYCAHSVRKSYLDTWLAS